MAGKEREIIKAPKYDPPYPQSFYPFWPRHAITATICCILLLAVPVVLTYYFRVPTDPNMPPLPDDGMWMPAPEWYLFLLFQPYWYLIGEELGKWLTVGTFWVPFILLVFILLVPVLFKRKRAVGERIGLGKKILLALTMWVIWGAVIGGVVGAGYPAKTTGCTSCHNPMMGARQALPPADIAEFYRVERARQIEVGKYRIGDQNHMGSSYKDSNWQLRHFYEPTMTW